MSISMNSSALKMPKFHQNQRVAFIGGIGKIKTRRVDSTDWLYAVEMPINPDQELHRTSRKTTLFLLESELDAVEDP
ncbi:MAG TPA: hypothetical protein ACFE0H_10400 [Elainellaceae cyanobacterium]